MRTRGMNFALQSQNAGRPDARESAVLIAVALRTVRLPSLRYARGLTFPPSQVLRQTPITPRPPRRAPEQTLSRSHALGGGSTMSALAPS
jgi:hypothetical protein